MSGLREGNKRVLGAGHWGRLGMTRNECVAAEPRVTFTGPDEATNDAEAGNNASTEVDEDHELVEVCRQGLSAGYRNLYEKYGHRIYAFARRFLSDEQHAEDVTQEVFVQ